MGMACLMLGSGGGGGGLVGPPVCASTLAAGGTQGLCLTFRALARCCQSAWVRTPSRSCSASPPTPGSRPKSPGSDTCQPASSLGIFCKADLFVKMRERMFLWDLMTSGGREKSFASWEQWCWWWWWGPFFRVFRAWNQFQPGPLGPGMEDMR